MFSSLDLNILLVLRYINSLKRYIIILYYITIYINKYLCGLIQTNQKQKMRNLTKAFFFLLYITLLETGNEYGSKDRSFSDLFILFNARLVKECLKLYS